MICLGNICRSPLAEGILKHKLLLRGLDWHVDSAGTGGWHAGDKPDTRSIAKAREFGIDITSQRARQIKKADFDAFDHILTMDATNFLDVLHLADNEKQRQKVAMIMNFPRPDSNTEVPDPYYDNRFQLVFDMLEEACDAVIEKLSQK